MKALIVALCLLSPVAFAGDLLLGQYSYHFDMCGDKNCPDQHAMDGAEPYYDKKDCVDGCTRYAGTYRKYHPLIGYSNGKYTAVAMINSIDEPSVVVLRNFSYDFNPYIRPMVSLGLGTGYDKVYKSIGPFTPLGYFSFDFHPKHDRFGIVVTWLPTIMVSVGPRFRF